MNYPTMEQVEAADHEQLARWQRFLSSPMDKQVEILRRLLARMQEFGGMTTAISKKIGWDAS